MPSSRADRVETVARELDLELILITSAVSVEYLTGFTGSNGACLVGPGRRLFLTDFRYREWIASGFEGWDTEVVEGEWLAGVASRIAPRTGIEDDRMTVRIARDLETRAGAGVELIPAGPEIQAVRRSKDDLEVAAIREAARLTDSIMQEVFDAGLVGRTEAEVAGRIVSRLREEGAEPSFLPIVASGPNGASAHAEPGAREIPTGELVVVDMGARLDGYCSDCTRTVATGRIEEDVREIYDLVLTANLAALDRVRAGIGCAELDGVARDVIEEAGLGGEFGHGLGHGVGIEIHEAPRLGPRSDDHLVEGDVVTVEPGVYLAGRFGVRIEDLVLVGKEGVTENLSSHPKSLVEVS